MDLKFLKKKRLKKKNVLIIDDEFSSSAIASSILLAEGYNVQIVTSGLEAVNLISMT